MLHSVLISEDLGIDFTKFLAVVFLRPSLLVSVTYNLLVGTSWGLKMKTFFPYHIPSVSHKMDLTRYSDSLAVPLKLVIKLIPTL